jgi:hypothetical protein
MIEAARVRAEAHKKEWQHYLSRLSVWKAFCAERQMIYDKAEDHAPPTDRRLVKMLRRIAGICPSRRGAKAPVEEFKHYIAGSPGRYGVGPQMWDDIIRAFEDGG